MPAGGGDVTNLTHHASGDTTPAWSLDGSKLAFMSWRDGNGGIYVMNADGGDPEVLVQEPFEENGDPAWSPDGTKTAYTTMSMDGGVATYDVYVIGVDGGTETRLTDDPEPDSMPAWSPDGRKIAFQGYRDGYPSAEIYVMNADGSAQIRLTCDAAFEGAAAWRSLPPIVATDALVRQVDDLVLAKNAAASFLALLREVRTSLENGDTQDAIHRREAFIHQVEAQRGKTLPTDGANALIAVGAPLFTRSEDRRVRAGWETRRERAGSVSRFRWSAHRRRGER